MYLRTLLAHAPISLCAITAAGRSFAMSTAVRIRIPVGAVVAVGNRKLRDLGPLRYRSIRYSESTYSALKRLMAKPETFDRSPGPEDAPSVREGLELVGAFRKIRTAGDSRRVTELAKRLSTKALGNAVTTPSGIGIFGSLFLARTPPDLEKSNNIAHKALDFRSVWSVDTGPTKDQKHGPNCSRCCHQSSSR
jgi:hypothetical protein